MGTSQLKQSVVDMLTVGFERRFALFYAQDEHTQGIEKRNYKNPANNCWCRNNFCCFLNNQLKLQETTCQHSHNKSDYHGAGITQKYFVRFAKYIEIEKGCQCPYKRKTQYCAGHMAVYPKPDTEDR